MDSLSWVKVRGDNDACRKGQATDTSGKSSLTKGVTAPGRSKISEFDGDVRQSLKQVPDDRWRNRAADGRLPAMEKVPLLFDKTIGYC